MCTVCEPCEDFTKYWQLILFLHKKLNVSEVTVKKRVSFGKVSLSPDHKSHCSDRMSYTGYSIYLFKKNFFFIHLKQKTMDNLILSF